jgi:hypothetical protein
MQEKEKDVEQEHRKGVEQVEQEYSVGDDSEFRSFRFLKNFL